MRIFTTAFCLFFLLGLSATQAAATLGERSIGNNCTNGSAATDFDTIAQCSSLNATAGAMQKAPLFVGGVTSPPYATTSCGSDKAGLIQFTASSFQVCDGTAWKLLAAASSLQSGYYGFQNLTKQIPSTLVTSNSLVFASTGTAAVSVAGPGSPQLSIAGGAWATSGTVAAGQTIQLRQTMSASLGTAVTATLTTGTGTDAWKATTAVGKVAYAYTGGAQTFVVPAGVTSVQVKMWGGGGGGGSGGGTATGGGGGYTTGFLAVTPGESLTIVVAGGGAGSSSAGGYGGGGSGVYYGGSGGGRSCIQRSAADIMTAGGGGGGGFYNSGYPAYAGGGAGGGLSGTYGGNGSSYNGGGGTQGGGGAAGIAPGYTAGSAGSKYAGGYGGNSAGTEAGAYGAGGGGGGYYGGGGGGVYYGWAGAGGGSGYVGSATSAVTTSGSGTTPGNSGDVDYVSGVGIGGSGGGSGTGGRVVIYY